MQNMKREEPSLLRARSQKILHTLRNM